LDTPLATSDPSDVFLQVNGSSSADVAASTFWLSDPCSSFDFFYNTVFLGTLCLCGIAANLLSIVVLYLDRHNRVATFLLRSLAVADVCVLVTFIVAMSIFFGTHSVPGFYVQYTRYAIPYLKKVRRTQWRRKLHDKSQIPLR